MRTSISDIYFDAYQHVPCMEMHLKKHCKKNYIINNLQFKELKMENKLAFMIFYIFQINVLFFSLLPYYVLACIPDIIFMSNKDGF